MTTFDVHHHGDRNATGSPLFDALREVTHRAHVAVHLVEGEHRGGEAEAVAVVGVEVRRSGAAAFVTEEVVEGAELALEVLAALEVLLDHLDDELFGFDEGNLHVAVAVAFEHQLALSCGREALEDFGRSLGNPVAELFNLGSGVEAFDFFFVVGEGFGEFGNEHADIRDEFEEAFRNQADTEVLAVSGTGSDDVCNVLDDLLELHLLGLDFFRNQADVRMGLESGFESDVRSATAHELDEVPVLLSGVGIAHDVADEFGIGLDGSVETEGGFDVFVLEVAVDGLRAAANHAGSAVGLEVFTENCSVRVGVVTTDNHDSVELLGLGNGHALLELFFSFELGTARLDDVESTSVAVGVHDLFVDHDELAVLEAGGAAEEAEELGILADALDTVEDTRDHVVSTRSLATGEHHAHVQSLTGSGLGSLLHADVRSAVGVREQGLDLGLVADGLGGLALHESNFESAVAESGGEFRLVGLAGLAEDGQIVSHCCFLLSLRRLAGRRSVGFGLKNYGSKYRKIFCDNATLKKIPGQAGDDKKEAQDDASRRLNVLDTLVAKRLRCDGLCCRHLNCAVMFAEPPFSWNLRGFSVEPSLQPVNTEPLLGTACNNRSLPA